MEQRSRRVLGPSSAIWHRVRLNVWSWSATAGLLLAAVLMAIGKGGASESDAGRVRLVQVLEDGVDGVEGLYGARSVAVSPEGAHVYLASQFADALVVFRRDATTGRLDFVEAHRNGTGGVDGLADARQVEVSPDGAHVYVASAGDSAIAVFARDAATGRLTFSQVQRDGLPGDGPTGGPVGICLSPDGANLYAAGVGQNSVAVFARDAVGGLLTPIEVVPIDLPPTSVYVSGNPGGVQVSPDGAHVYAVGQSDGAVTAFRRDPVGGRLTRIGSWRNAVDGVAGLTGAFSLALSRDGANVYVAGSAAHSIATFARDAGTGGLAFIDAASDVPGGLPGLKGTRAVALGPDDRHVYATGMNAKALVLYSRDEESGRLAIAEIRRDVVPGWIGMGEVHGFAISRDGRHLYLPSRSYNALLVFSTDEGGMAPLVRCIGDCDASTSVTMEELVRGVNIAQERTALSACEMFDRDGSRTVTVDELIAGVRSDLSGCTDPLTPGDHWRVLPFGGAQRVYVLHVPTGYDGHSPVPLVIDTHGLQSNPTRASGLFGFRTVSDAEGFIVAWPLGLFGKADAPEAETGSTSTDGGPSFNAGWCCGAAALAQKDDVGFIRAMVQAISAEANIDRARVYATGHSNGGHLSYRLACEAADIVAAVAPVAGRVALYPLSTCQPSRPIAVIEFAGLHDPSVPYHENFFFSPSAPESFAFWRDTDGCGSGPPDDRLEFGASYCETYLNCDGGVQVELCSVEASLTSYVPGHVLYLNPDIDIARTAWEFLSRFRLPAASGL